MSDLTKPDQPDLNPTPSPSDSSNSHWPPEATNGFVDEGAQPSEREVEGAVPPGYDWPTHGGYLGCLCGVVASFVVFGLIGANLLSFYWASGAISGPLFILLAIVVFFVLAYLFGRAGFVLGKRFYRAYPQAPGQRNWGEDESVRIEAGAGDAVLASERAQFMGRIGTLGGGIVGGIIGVAISLKLLDALGILGMPVGTLEGLALLVSFIVLAFVVLLACIYFASLAGRKLLTRAEANAPTTAGAITSEAKPAHDHSAQ